MSSSTGATSERGVETVGTEFDVYFSVVPRSPVCRESAAALSVPGEQLFKLGSSIFAAFEGGMCCEAYGDMVGRSGGLGQIRGMNFCMYC